MLSLVGRPVQCARWLGIRYGWSGVAERLGTPSNRVQAGTMVDRLGVLRRELHGHKMSNHILKTAVLSQRDPFNVARNIGGR
jgi:hypothetical protein